MTYRDEMVELNQWALENYLSGMLAQTALQTLYYIN
jgi:hypothetical protein